MHGRYVAGYYFNDALFRIDVGFENALRNLTGLRNITDKSRT